MATSFSEARRVLDPDVPVADREGLLLICKEIDEDTPEAEIDSFIQSAHTYLYDMLDGRGLSLPMMKQIEVYLAAHFAALTYPSVHRETVGPLSTTYMGKVEYGLLQTRYGQMAISLDPTGRLKKLSDGEGIREVKIKSLGSGVFRPV